MDREWTDTRQRCVLYYIIERSMKNERGRLAVASGALCVVVHKAPPSVAT
jgi:hypothetical protein